jgi:hypothetical protein
MNHKTQPYSLAGETYQKYGGSQPINIFEADPVNCAIDGPGGINNMFACAGNPRRTQIGLNEAFMAQRCAANWDGYCDMYGNQQFNADFTGKKFNMFIRDTLSRMFCQNDTSIPGAQCVQRCEQYNPTSSSSVSVCMDQGDLVFRASDKEYALDTIYPQTGKLQTASPIRFTKCPKTCNVLNADHLTDKNIALNIALQRGIAMDLIENLVQNIVSLRMQDKVENQMLKQFMKQYVMDGTVKPGFSSLGISPLVSSRQVALPAVIDVIPPNTILAVNENKGIEGNQMIQVSDVPATLAQLEAQNSASQSVASATPSAGIISASNNNVEPFRYVVLGEETTRNNTMKVVALIIGIGILLFLLASFMMKKNTKSSSSAFSSSSSSF